MGTCVADIPLNDLLANINTSRLYMYVGSLTTPPCTEGVTFLIVDDP